MCICISDADDEDSDDKDDDADDDDDDEDYNAVADAAIIAAVEIVYRWICVSLPILLLMLIYLILLSSAAITAGVVKSDTNIIAAASDVYIHSRDEAAWENATYAAATEL